jgi:hypothetical protein
MIKVGASLPERLACIFEGQASEHEQNGSFEAGVALRGAGRAARALTDSEAEAVLAIMDARGSTVRFRGPDIYGKTGKQILEMVTRGE